MPGSYLRRSAALIHHQHDEISGRAADLKADAATFYANTGRRRPPPAFAAAGKESFAVFSAKEERGGLEIRNDHDTLGSATAARRSVVKVAMPHFRGKWSPTKAIVRILDVSFI